MIEVTVVWNNGMILKAPTCAPGVIEWLSFVTDRLNERALELQEEIANSIIFGTPISKDITL